MHLYAPLLRLQSHIQRAICASVGVWARCRESTEDAIEESSGRGLFVGWLRGVPRPASNGAPRRRKFFYFLLRLLRLWIRCYDGAPATTAPSHLVNVQNFFRLELCKVIYPIPSLNYLKFSPNILMSTSLLFSPLPQLQVEDEPHKKFFLELVILYSSLLQQATSSFIYSDTRIEIYNIIYTSRKIGSSATTVSLSFFPRISVYSLIFLFFTLDL